MPILSFEILLTFSEDSKISYLTQGIILKGAGSQHFPNSQHWPNPLIFFHCFPQLIELFSRALTTRCSFPNIVLYGIIFMLYGLRAFNMFLSQLLLSIWKSTYNVKPWLAFKTIDSILNFKDIFYKLRSLIIILLMQFWKTIQLTAYGENWTVA